MSTNNFDFCLNVILHHEGGYVNHPRDPGGITNLGVTKAVYDAWIKRKATVEEMKGLTPALVAPLYRINYWNKVKGDSLPLGLDLCVFDFAVNAGPSRAIRYLQMMVNVKQDGVLGPMTLEKVNKYVETVGNDTAVKKYQELRRGYYKKLKTFATFGKGWLRRVNGVEATAIKM
jgi:lysozyme family protein